MVKFHLNGWWFCHLATPNIWHFIARRKHSIVCKPFHNWVRVRQKVGAQVITTKAASELSLVLHLCIRMRVIVFILLHWERMSCFGRQLSHTNANGKCMGNHFPKSDFNVYMKKYLDKSFPTVAYEGESKIYSHFLTLTIIPLNIRRKVALIRV